MKPIHTIVMEPDRQIRNRICQVISEDRRLSVMNPELEHNQLLNEIPALVRHNDTYHALLLGIDRMESAEMQLLITLRREVPSLPVIVLTRHDHKGAAIALAALRKGAVEFILKTSIRTGSVQTLAHFRKRLVPVIKALPRMNRKYLAAYSPINGYNTPLATSASSSPKPLGARIDLVVIAGCLGGVPALYHLVATLPEDLPIPVVIVQHMPEIYTEVLAQELNSLNGLEVAEAGEGVRLAAGQVWVAPGDYHPVLKNRKASKVLSLSRAPDVKGFRPSIDVFLTSVARQIGNRVLVTFLSGGGNDGIEGARYIDEAGGQIIIQNRRTSLLWDMPYRIGSMGIETYPLERLGSEIRRRIVQ